MNRTRPYGSLLNNDLLELAISSRDPRVVQDVLNELGFRTSRKAKNVLQELEEYLEVEDDDHEDDDYEDDDYEDDDDTDESLQVFKEDVFEHNSGEGARPDARLQKSILQLTGGGNTPFIIGITARPSNRSSDYQNRGFSEMHVLCESKYWGTIRALEKRLVAWAHREKHAVQNAPKTPPGRKPSKFNKIRLYLVI